MQMVYNSDNYVVVQFDLPHDDGEAASEGESPLAGRFRDRRQVRAQGDLHRGRDGRGGSRTRSQR